MSEALVPWIQLPAVDATFAKDATALIEAAEGFDIDCPELRVLADKDLSAVKSLKKVVDVKRKALTGPLDAAKKSVMDQYRPATEFLERAEAIWTQKILGYDRVEAQKRAEAQRLANEEAARTRAALEAQAESLRESAPEAATALVEASQMVAAPVIPIGVPKSEQSTSHRVTWSAELVSLVDLALAVATGEAPIECISANLTYLNGRARLEHGAMKIPGVKAVATEGLSQKRA